MAAEVWLSESDSFSSRKASDGEQVVHTPVAREANLADRTVRLMMPRDVSV
jgi:hypothetical protein